MQRVALDLLRSVLTGAITTNLPSRKLVRSAPPREPRFCCGLRWVAGASHHERSIVHEHYFILLHASLHLGYTGTTKQLALDQAHTFGPVRARVFPECAFAQGLKHVIGPSPASHPTS